MINVLLTRPRAASESLGQELKQHGYASVIEPLLIIEPLRTPCPDISGIEAVMITSGNALDAGQGLSAFYDFPCFCVGQRTAAKARAAGFRDVRSAAGDGIELARLIESAFKGEKTALLHVCGQEIDSKAQDELTRTGHRVVLWPVYAAHPAPALMKSTMDMLRNKKISAVLVFSVRTAQVLKALLKQNGLEACCKDLIAIGLSDAVADVLRPLPWRRLVAASAPTEDAMIECLKQIQTVS